MKKLLIIDDEQNIVNSLVREVSAWTRDRDIQIKGFTSPLDAMVYVKKTRIFS
ncbi:MAG: hypothetical protein JEY99_01590 [Spirochaetales bacterium]|nr:hypothetical protein [Spirochaetales bacterium]